MGKNIFLVVVVRSAQCVGFDGLRDWDFTAAMRYTGYWHVFQASVVAHLRSLEVLQERKTLHIPFVIRFKI